MQFVENFVVLSWSVSLRVKKLWEFYLMMRSLQNFLRFYGIFSEVLKMNVARSGDTKIWFVPFIEKRGGYISPCPPGSDASACVSTTVGLVSSTENVRTEMTKSVHDKIYYYETLK